MNLNKFLRPEFKEKLLALKQKMQNGGNMRQASPSLTLAVTSKTEFAQEDSRRLAMCQVVLQGAVEQEKHGMEPGVAMKQGLEAQRLTSHTELLRNDILKKRALMEKVIQKEIQKEIQLIKAHKECPNKKELLDEEDRVEVPKAKPKEAYKKVPSKSKKSKILKPVPILKIKYGDLGKRKKMIVNRKRNTRYASLSERSDSEESEFDFESDKRHGMLTNSQPVSRPSQLIETVQNYLQDQDITTEIDSIVDSALQRINETEKMCELNGVLILRRHLATLNHKNWLVDEVMDFYFNLIVERSKSDKLPSAYAHNSFFFTALLRTGINGVLRWTNGINIFSYEIVFIPLHFNNHWALCVIDNRTDPVKQTDTINGADSKKTDSINRVKSIRYYDSFGSGHNDNIIQEIRNYLIAEKKDKTGIIMDPDEYQLEVVEGLPKQKNGYDCGVFALKYAEYISRDAAITFDQAHITNFRRQMVYEILTKQLL